MKTLKTLLVLSLATIASTTAPVYARPMKLENAWAFYVTVMKRWVNTNNPSIVGTVKEFSTCDYTSKTCKQGYHWGPQNMILTILDGNDRKTELGHFSCDFYGYACLNFDTGERTGRTLELSGPQGLCNGMKCTLEERTVNEDMPQVCVKPWDTVPSECENWIKMWWRGYLIFPPK